MKINIRFIAMPLIAFVLAFSAIGIPSVPVHADNHIIYVNRYSGGANDGSSWSNAFNKLQDALDAAGSGDQIWVSWGIYYPDEGLNQTNGDRNSTFTLKNGVEVYGGFEGNETLLSQRNINANPVVLSGDIDENDVNTDGNNIAETTADIVGSNSYHVVRGGTATASTILDGFIITAGDADGPNFDNSGGGGLFNWGTSPTLNNLTFSGNYGFLGGGMYNYNTASPALTNVVFSGNQADNGGGMFNTSATPTMANVTFDNNTANIGGGLYNTVSSPTLENTTFLNNTAVSYGGGMFNTSGSHATLMGVIFTGNGATTTGGGVYNSQSNPTLTNVTFDNNTAQSGGGLTNSQSNPTLTNVTFTNNSATNGGGISNNTNSNAILANVTFSNNSAVNNGGGFYSGGNSTATLTNVTFSGNSSGFGSGGGGIFALGGTITLKNTIIANSTGGDCNLSGSTIGTGSGNNLIEDTGNDACGLIHGTNSDIIGSDPNLGSLTGSPAYFPLNLGSPAINAGSNTACAAAPVNNESQNGINRPQGANCDIGAFEFEILEPTFADVPLNHPYWLDIEILYANGLTAGCSATPLNFCPETIMNRAESAVFMLKGNFGNLYTPPSAPWNTFADNWASGTWAEKWAEGMYAEGLTAGCALNPLRFCPWDQTNREQAAVFGLKLMYGDAYLPPAATGDVFADMTDPNHWSTRWTEQAYADGLLPSCGIGAGGKPNFCPASLVSRGLAAYMIVRAKSLTMP